MLSTRSTPHSHLRQIQHVIRACVLSVFLVAAASCTNLGWPVSASLSDTFGSSSSPNTSTGTSRDGDCVRTSYASQYAWEVVQLTNLERASRGLEPLEWNNNLAEAAAAMCCEMINRDFFDHVDPDGKNVVDRAEAAGYTSWYMLGENLAGGQYSPEEVVQAWMDSPGHRENILEPDFTEIGVAYREGGSYRTYWTQVFGTPR